MWNCGGKGDKEREEDEKRKDEMISIIRR